MRKFFSLIIILMFIAAGSVFAQNAQELRIGSFSSGNLRQGQEVWYSVRTTQAGVLSVETESSIDTYLEAYDAQRNLIREDDDSAGNYNARIELIVQANVTYFFKVRAYSRDDSGSFRVFAAIKPLAALRMGSAVNGNIAAGDIIWYSVQASQRGYLTIETSGAANIMTWIYDENMELLAYGEAGERVRINAVQGRTYYARLESIGSGAFRITANNQAYPAPVTLNIGSSLNGTVAPAGENWYSVRVTQNGLLTVQAASAIDTVLNAYDSNYNHLAYDDDSAGDLNPRIRIPVTAGNVYYFALKGLGTNTGGSFSISASTPVFTPLTVGSFVNGYMENGRDFWYSVRATQSGYLIVETTGNVDTVLEAYDVNFNHLAFDDDGTGTYNAKIRIPVATGSIYHFLLRSNATTYVYSENDYASYSYGSGSFRILASSQPFPTPTPLNVGSFLNGNIGNEGEIWYSVRTTRSGHLTVETTGSTDTVLDAFASDYQHIERNDDNEDLNARIRINGVSANTTYIFRLTSFGPGPFRIYAIMD